MLFVLPAIYLISGYPAVYATEGYDLVTYKKSKFHDFLPLLASTEKLLTRRVGFELAPSLGTPVCRSTCCQLSYRVTGNGVLINLSNLSARDILATT